MSRFCRSLSVLGRLRYALPLKHPASPCRLHQRVEPTVKPAGYHNGLTPLHPVNAFANDLPRAVPQPAWRDLFDVVHTRCGLKVGMGEAGAEGADVYSTPLHGQCQHFRQRDDTGLRGPIVIVAAAGNASSDRVHVNHPTMASCNHRRHQAMT